jgi:ABC-type glycerol-3-phosphate transport system substrate-binding protein
MLVLLGTLVSCGAGEALVLWTDRPEFAVYAEHFNSAQDLYKAEVRYSASLALELARTGEYPDIAVGNWLMNAAARTLFEPLDRLFRNKTLGQDDFYPRLLSLGSIENRQYLLPVSFNIPALVFTRDNSGLLSNPFTIGLEETKKLGMEYNQQTGGIYSRMGFSPAWNDEFLFLTAKLFNSGFQEADPLAWDARALEEAILYNQRWIEEANTGFQEVEDFTFKYFYDPPAKLLLSGHILFTYMGSAEFFTMAQDRRSTMDFRWILRNNSIPLNEDIVYYGICKRGRAKKAAEAFTRWFFSGETQTLLLETSRNKRMNESSFGIGGGFSALRSVTEQIFPRFYPGLVGHIPPDDYLSPPSTLPQNWTALKERVILPYMHERIRRENREEVSPLARRISDWTRLNRD